MNTKQENKIKQLFMSQDDKTLLLAFKILQENASLLPFKTHLFALSFYHENEVIREEAKTLFYTVIPEDFKQWLEWKKNYEVRIILEEFRASETEPRATHTLNAINKFGVLDTEILANLTLYWRQIGFLFGFQHQVKIWESCGHTLKKLTLQGKFTAQMGSFLPYFPNLRHLDIARCNLTQLPQELVCLPKLSVLKASHNQIIDLQVILQCPQLKAIDLAYNLIEEIPSPIDQLSLLQRLDLSYNQLIELPISICNLRQLKALYLQKNLLLHLPVDIGSLKKLQILDIYGNQLDTIPDSLKQLPNLNELYLGSNHFKQVPDFINHFPLKKPDFLWSSSEEWEFRMLALSGALYFDTDLNTGEYCINPQERWSVKNLQLLLESENILEDYVQQQELIFGEEVFLMIESGEYTSQEVLDFITKTHRIIESYSDYYFLYDDYIPSIQREDTHLARELFPTKSDIFSAYNNEEDLAYIRLLAQQAFYINNDLLPYFENDDVVDVLYEQVKINPWLWALQKEDQLQICQAIEGEWYDI